jgi:hypothetical protein
MLFRSASAAAHSLASKPRPFVPFRPLDETCCGCPGFLATFTPNHFDAIEFRQGIEPPV